MAKSPKIKTTVESGHELTPSTVKMGEKAKRENSLWWALPAGKKDAAGAVKPHDAVVALVGKLRSDQNTRYLRIARHMRLYGGKNFTNLDATGYQRENIRDDTGISFNGVQSVTDTLTSKTAQHTPVPTSLTPGG